ncbi:MAG: TIGR02300 family protein [Rhizomicrobium sp.]
MDKAALGTKRVCPSCGARFYDLAKRPIECPKCSFTFEPEAIFKQRRRQAEVEDKTPQDAEESEQDTEVEVEEGIIESVEDEPELTTGEEDDEVVHDEPAHAGPGMSVVDADDVSIEDIDDDAVEEDDSDDALLEPDEGDEDDVSGIIDADIEKDER